MKNSFIIFLGILACFLCRASGTKNLQSSFSTVYKNTLNTDKFLVNHNKPITSSNSRSHIKCDKNNITFSAVGDTATIKSPGYPDNYPSSFHEHHCFFSPPGTIMEVDCPVFKVEYSYTCFYDYLLLSLNGDLNYDDGYRTFCGCTFSKRYSSGNTLPIVFQSDSSIEYSGFECQVTVVDPASKIDNNNNKCSELSSIGEEMEISSPEFPNRYPSNFNSEQCFVSPPRTKMSISCDHFDIEYDSECRYDKFSISLSGDFTNDKKTLCGACFENVTTHANKLAVSFHTDNIWEYNGYRCFIKVIAEDNRSLRMLEKCEATNVEKDCKNPNSTALPVEICVLPETKNNFQDSISTYE